MIVAALPEIEIAYVPAARLFTVPLRVKLPVVVTVPDRLNPEAVPVPETLVTVPVVLDVPAPMAVRKVAASKDETVLSALNRGKLIAATFASVNKLPPRVVAPRFVLAAAAVVPPVPPLPIATVPVTFAAVPVVFWLPAVLTPGRLMSAEPLKLTPPMLRAVWRVVAVVALPLNAAVIVPALKLPEASRATMVEAVFALVAFDATVNVELPDWLAVNVAEPDRPVPETAIVNVPLLTFAAVVAVVALPLSAAVMVPAEKLPEASRATMAEAVFALVAVVAALGILVEAVKAPVPLPYT